MHIFTSQCSTLKKKLIKMSREQLQDSYALIFLKERQTATVASVPFTKTATEKLDTQKDAC